jgi:hypothetical protein
MPLVMPWKLKVYGRRAPGRCVHTNCPRLDGYELKRIRRRKTLEVDHFLSSSFGTSSSMSVKAYFSQNTNIPVIESQHSCTFAHTPMQMPRVWCRHNWYFKRNLEVVSKYVKVQSNRTTEASDPLQNGVGLKGLFTNSTAKHNLGC